MATQMDRRKEIWGKSIETTEAGQSRRQSVWRGGSWGGEKWLGMRDAVEAQEQWWW